MDNIFDETQPIYYQIVQRTCAQILRGDYKPGDKLPSVIEGAMHFKVNHNTMARVYTELINQGIAVTRRGEGTFVTEDEKVLENLHQTMRTNQMQSFFEEMQRLGYSAEEILSAMQAFIEKKQAEQSSQEERGLE
jgi:GntR family transcriptional regulator